MFVSWRTLKIDRYKLRTSSSSETDVCTTNIDHCAAGCLTCRGQGPGQQRAGGCGLRTSQPVIRTGRLVVFPHPRTCVLPLRVLTSTIIHTSMFCRNRWQPCCRVYQVRYLIFFKVRKFTVLNFHQLSIKITSTHSRYRIFRAMIRFVLLLLPSFKVSESRYHD